ncbi:MAG: RNA 2',3'-cyclic phosphodiesterase [Candidatus Roseilinea sp.]|nr:MAG: RNA 2',3'-cyclic phosphodiesterase [Candidatus Roseilinea sp.]
MGQPEGRLIYNRSVQRAKQPTLRAFLALDFDDDALRVLDAYLRRLRAMPWANDVRWVRPDNLHLTLRFLGDVTPSQAERYAEAFGEGLARMTDLTAFTLAATPPRFFPTPSRPRVIACLIEGNPTLTALAALAETCALRIGLERETRPFNGHITLGRTRDSFPRDAALPRDETVTDMRPITITLYESKLDPRGAMYTPLRSFSLGSHL